MRAETPMPTIPTSWSLALITVSISSMQFCCGKEKSGVTPDVTGCTAPLSVGGTSRDPQWTLKLGTARNPACSTEDSHWRCGCILRHKGRSLCTTTCFFNPTLHLKSVFFHQKFSRIVIVVAVKRFLLCEYLTY